MMGLFTTLALLLLTLCSALPAASFSPLTRQERFGVAFTELVWQGEARVGQDLQDYHVAPLGIGWYSDWQMRAIPPQPADAVLEYAQLLEVRDDVWPPNWGEVQNIVAYNPGALWIIGNEPECPNQGNLTPAEYAARYREAYVRIKGWDYSAQVAIGGVVEVTPLRLRWIEAVMDAYQTAFGSPIHVDVWNIHIQILSEGPGNAGAGEPVGIDWVLGEPVEYSYTDCANVEVFKQMVTDFREWMAAHGQRNKPLIISEMGVLQPSYLLYEDWGMSEEERAAIGDRLIEQFMVHAFDWLLQAADDEIGYPDDANHLVQRWLWFSLNDSFYDEDTNPRGFNGALYDYRDQTLTRFGERFAAYQAQTYRLVIPSVRK
jgi:hypothetical protein